MCETQKISPHISWKIPIVAIIYQNKYGIPISHWYYLPEFSLDLNAFMVRTYSAFFSFFLILYAQLQGWPHILSLPASMPFFAMRLCSFFQGKGSLFLYFLNLDLDVWQVMAKEKLENLIETEAWQVLENWGSSCLAILGNSYYHQVNEPPLALEDEWLSTQLLPLTLASGMWMRPSATNQITNHPTNPKKWVNSTNTLLSREEQSYLSPAQNINLCCSEKKKKKIVNFSH